MYAINAFLISNKQTVNFSQPFPFFICRNFSFLAFVLALYHHSVSGWFSFNAPLMHNKKVYACLFMQNGKKKNCTGQESLWLLFSFLFFCLFVFYHFHHHHLFAKHFFHIHLSPVQRYISVNIQMHAGLQLIIVQMSDDFFVWFGLILSYLYHCLFEFY